MARTTLTPPSGPGNVADGHVRIEMDGNPRQTAPVFAAACMQACQQAQDLLTAGQPAGYLGQVMTGENPDVLRVFQLTHWVAEWIDEVDIPGVWDNCWSRLFPETARLAAGTSRRTFTFELLWHETMRAVQGTITGPDRVDHFRIRAIPAVGHQERIAAILWSSMGCTHDGVAVDRLPCDLSDPAMAAAVDDYLWTGIVGLLSHCEVCSLFTLLRDGATPARLTAAARLVDASGGRIGPWDVADMSALLAGADPATVALAWSLHCDRRELSVAAVCDAVRAATA